MKILFYAPRYIFDEDTGGSSTHFRELVENLSKLGNKIVVICQLKNSAYNTDVTIKRPIKRVNIPLIGEALAYILELLLGLITLIKEKPDLIYTRGSFSAHTFILTALFTCPRITEVNGLLKDQLKVSSKKLSTYSKIIGYIFAQANENTYKYSQHLIAVTPGIKKSLEMEFKIDPSNITIIENGANIELFKPMEITKVKKELRLNQTYHYVCFVGTFAPWQGVEYLVHAAPLILKDILNVRFLIVGDGVIKEELINIAEKTGVSDKIIFTGIAPYEEVPKYINASDVCVVYKKPLKSGYSPLKLYEYMACGKPVVASNLPGFEILEESNAGISVEPENPNELAKAIIKLLEDEKLMQEMGRNGREYVIKNHSWESVAKRVAEVCESVIK